MTPHEADRCDLDQDGSTRTVASDQPCERTPRSPGGCSTRDDVMAQICFACEARAAQKLSPGRTGISDSGRCRRVFRWHAARLTAPGGPALHELRTAVSRRECAPSDRAGSFRDIPRAGRQLARRRRPAPLRRAGVPGLSSVWMAHRWVRAVSLRRLRPRPRAAAGASGHHEVSGIAETRRTGRSCAITIM